MTLWSVLYPFHTLFTENNVLMLEFFKIGIGLNHGFVKHRLNAVQILNWPYMLTECF